MSLLDPIDEQINKGNNYVIRTCALKDNPYRKNLSTTEYVKYLDIYTRIVESYVKFFTDYWYKDDVEKTNEMMTEELIRKEVIKPGMVWTGLTEEENNPLGEYVLTLDCPATADAMRELFRRVLMGDLEFRCTYPINDTTALKLIRENISQDFIK